MKSRKIVSILLISMILFLLMPYINVQALSKNRILVLNSYNRGYEWTNDIEEGLKSTLIDDGRNLDLQYEYMDAKESIAKSILRS